MKPGPCACWENIPPKPTPSADLASCESLVLLLLEHQDSRYILPHNQLSIFRSRTIRLHLKLIVRKVHSSLFEPFCCYVSINYQGIWFPHEVFGAFHMDTHSSLCPTKQSHFLRALEGSRDDRLPASLPEEAFDLSLPALLPHVYIRRLSHLHIPRLLARFKNTVHLKNPLGPFILTSSRFVLWYSPLSVAFTFTVIAHTHTETHTHRHYITKITFEMDFTYIPLQTSEV